MIDGIPVIARDLADLLRTEALPLLARALPSEVTAALVEAGPDDAPLPHMTEQRGAYLDASWGDLAEPFPEGPRGPLPFGFAALADKLSARASEKVARALELGCSVGRGLARLARGAELTVGLDRSAGALRLARRLLRGEQVEYGRRTSGRAYVSARVQAGSEAVPAVQLICGDALDPPFAPGSFDRVAALNLLDNVSSPRVLLHQLHQLAAPGGEILLSSPYAWRTGIVEEGERLGDLDPAQALRDEVRALGWSIEDDDPRVPWELRRDARAASLYSVHWLRARR